ncbi:MAG: hypothetical protein SFY32_15785 [Bacteroidota bacterium]|nr:hypothetical protein [Bacteroidota bacterium]
MIIASNITRQESELQILDFNRNLSAIERLDYLTFIQKNSFYFSKNARVMNPSEENFYFDFIEKLTEYKVAHLIIGGYAVNYYGYVRNTGDFDIWVKPGWDNLQNLVKSIESMKINIRGNVDFMQKTGTIDGILTLSKGFYRIEIQTEIDGLKSFDFSLKNAQKSKYKNVELNFISYEDLIDNKNATTREKDKIDVLELRKINKK